LDLWKGLLLTRERRVTPTKGWIAICVCFVVGWIYGKVYFSKVRGWDEYGNEDED
jgi:hypothetical protein